MAEERIFIQSFKNRPCVDCPAASNMKNCTCPDLHRFSHGINKSAAIERMAKGLYEYQYPKMRPYWDDDDNGHKEFYLKRAEAALNALLGKGSRKW